MSAKGIAAVILILLSLFGGAAAAGSILEALTNSVTQIEGVQP